MFNGAGGVRRRFSEGPEDGARVMLASEGFRVSAGRAESGLSSERGGWVLERVEVVLAEFDGSLLCLPGCFSGVKRSDFSARYGSFCSCFKFPAAFLHLWRGPIDNVTTPHGAAANPAMVPVWMLAFSGFSGGASVTPGEFSGVLCHGFPWSWFNLASATVVACISFLCSIVGFVVAGNFWFLFGPLFGTTVSV